jgi:hypothetical protein
LLHERYNEEAAIQAYLYHASLAGYGTKLVVGQVTGMVAERTAGRMRMVPTNKV